MAAQSLKNGDYAAMVTKLYENAEQIHNIIKYSKVLISGLALTFISSKASGRKALVDVAEKVIDTADQVQGIRVDNLKKEHDSILNQNSINAIRKALVEFNSCLTPLEGEHLFKWMDKEGTYQEKYRMCAAEVNKKIDEHWDDVENLYKSATANYHQALLSKEREKIKDEEMKQIKDLLKQLQQSSIKAEKVGIELFEFYDMKSRTELRQRWKQKWPSPVLPEGKSMRMA